MLALTFSTLNDADILDHFLRYHFDQGVDIAVVIDAGSEDATLDIIRSYEKTGMLIHLDTVSEQNREKNDRRNRMKQYCEDVLSASWIICSDPDEFWFTEQTSLKHALDTAAIGGAHVLLCQRYNMIATLPAEDPLESIGFDIGQYRYSIRRRCSFSQAEMETGEIPQPWVFSMIGPKVVFRAGHVRRVNNGGHGVTGKEKLTVRTPTDMSIRHFPLRSYAQFHRKVEMINGFVQSNELVGCDSWHWRRWLRLLRNGGLENEYAENFLSEEQLEGLRDEGTVVSEDLFVQRLLEGSDRNANAN